MVLVAFRAGRSRQQSTVADSYTVCTNFEDLRRQATDRRALLERGIGYSVVLQAIGQQPLSSTKLVLEPLKSFKLFKQVNWSDGQC